MAKNLNQQKLLAYPYAVPFFGFPLDCFNVISILIALASVSCQWTSKADMSLLDQSSEQPLASYERQCPDSLREFTSNTLSSIDNGFAYRTKREQGGKALGLIICKPSHQSELCSIRFKKNSELWTPEVYLPPTETSYIFQLFKNTRKDLATDKNQIVDITLTDSGSGSDCFLRFPRLPGEIYFNPTQSQVLFDSIRSEQPLARQTKPIPGSLLCRFNPATKTSSCWVRAWIGNVPYERVRELSIRNSEIFATLLYDALQDIKLTLEDSPKNISSGGRDDSNQISAFKHTPSRAKRPSHVSLSLDLVAHIKCSLQNSPPDPLILCQGVLSNTVQPTSFSDKKDLNQSHTLGNQSTINELNNNSLKQGT